MITLSDMPFSPEHLQEAAKRHLWMHFTRMGSYETQDVPVIVRGEGPGSGTPTASATSMGCQGYM